MKKINLKGISNALSNNEMKHVKGGVLKLTADPGSIEAVDAVAACDKKLPWAKCTMTWSGGTREGQCIDGNKDGKLSCRL